MKISDLVRLAGLLMAALVLVSCATSGTTPSATPSNVAPETNRLAPPPPPGLSRPMGGRSGG